jgi:hypothetical protein
MFGDGSGTVDGAAATASRGLCAAPNTFEASKKGNKHNDSQLNHGIMQVIKCLPAVTTFPTGDKSFAVQQGFPQVKSDAIIISMSLIVISHTFCLKILI